MTMSSCSTIRKAAHLEYWQHVEGCRQWLVLERDTATNTVGRSWLARDGATEQSHDPHDARRRPAGGRIDRTQSLAFLFEGRELTGYVGDTLASALLANGVTLIGRSFKYHRPRGLLAAGVEEPNGLLTLGTQGRRTPNVPATTTELYEGLICERQNGWPSVEFDLMAITGGLASLFEAGFYYKTFMGPRRGSWMFYEPFIRRAAGLGEATHLPDPDRYETANAFTDVLGHWFGSRGSRRCAGRRPLGLPGHAGRAGLSARRQPSGRTRRCTRRSLAPLARSRSRLDAERGDISAYDSHRHL